MKLLAFYRALVTMYLDMSMADADTDLLAAEIAFRAPSFPDKVSTWLF